MCSGIAKINLPQVVFIFLQFLKLFDLFQHFITTIIYTSVLPLCTGGSDGGLFVCLALLYSGV